MIDGDIAEDAESISKQENVEIVTTMRSQGHHVHSGYDLSILGW